MADLGPASTWRTVRSLSGTPSSTIFVEALLQRDRTLTTNKGKANAFMKEYAAVNNLCFDATPNFPQSPRVISETVAAGHILLQLIYREVSPCLEGRHHLAPFYRPVSLTSCVAKTLERMLHNKLHYLAKTRECQIMADKSVLCVHQNGGQGMRRCSVSGVQLRANVHVSDLACADVVILSSSYIGIQGLL